MAHGELGYGLRLGLLIHDMVRMEESVDMLASWATAQGRVVSMRMTWHALVEVSRRC